MSSFSTPIHELCSGSTIYYFLRSQAERNKGKVAIGTAGRKSLTYGHLCEHIAHVVETLNAMGVGRNDRVAIVLPNGAEMFVAFLGVASGATSAPLNPSYSAKEFRFYLTDLKAKALMVQAGTQSSARSVAENLQIPIIELVPSLKSEAGVFKLKGDVGSRPLQGGFGHPGDTALVLHTSGTTSRPKLVPLTQTNVFASAKNIYSALGLNNSDRCLSIMPLFHIHGLMAGAISSLVAGGSVVCTSEFSAVKFFECMEDFRPTWYTAVPTMHQAILAHAAFNRETIERLPLRFIRSCSAPLAPQVMRELEIVFKTPVIESYGMTEACHQIASNPVAPGKQKVGSVGIAAGPEVAIMNERGNLLSHGEIGEIVIRGANVTAGYDNNREANQTAFTGGWFRTGDQGYLDTDGYLFITGRLKEIINRGGEKISPREVDEALMDHPDVMQAVTFSVPHTRLGEDVAAALVLREGASVTQKEIREFLLARLSDFKVPSQSVIVNEIPKGPTGKVQRIGLAAKLALLLRKEYVPPSSPLENTLSKIWGEVLGVERVGLHDNFFALGGDSLLATRMMSRLRRNFQVEMSLESIFKDPTLAGQASIVEKTVLEGIENLTEEEASILLGDKNTK